MIKYKTTMTIFRVTNPWFNFARDLRLISCDLFCKRNNNYLLIRNISPSKILNIPDSLITHREIELNTIMLQSLGE